MTRQAQKNNRRCPRQPVQLDVTLHVSGQFPFCGKILNVSLGGLFVETDTTRLVGDAEVYVAFTFRTNTGTQHHRIPARSIRQNGNGVALLFTALDASDIQGLRQLVLPSTSSDARTLDQRHNPSAQPGRMRPAAGVDRTRRNIRSAS